MHTPKTNSPQLSRLKALFGLAGYRGLTPAQMRDAGVCDYHSAIAALRKNGESIGPAKLDRVTENGAKVFRYRLEQKTRCGGVDGHAGQPITPPPRVAVVAEDVG